ncbi:unnamed protein product [Cylindrotheca closterium]|uniref:FAM192A/Fyv6 N-terminal domain-containing protein n=1 Tax=Cylindrotheca closterium TaxID=2856 RepID=A0AAD2FVX6_9STRA|nr:unnamed protein product [Cylindrotheca closterium]
MSLSFVSSAVQTGRSDGGYDEVQIESKEKEAVNKRNEHKPLFEQLRKNQEEEDAKQEEMQLQMMRGTCALDEDDVAYLDSLEKRKLEKQREIQQQTQDEIAMFRAARVQKQESTLDDDDDDDDDDESDGSIVPLEKKMKPVEAEPSKAAAPVVKKGPMIVIKKRKRKGATAEPTNKPKALESKRKEQPEEKKGEPKQEKAEKSNQGGGLGGLLGGYGSSDDNSD